MAYSDSVGNGSGVTKAGPPRQVGPEFVLVVLIPVAHRIWECGRIGFHALHLALSRWLTEIGEATPIASRGRLRHQNLGT